MRKTSTAVLTALLIFCACQKNSTPTPKTEDNTETTPPTHRICAAYEVLQAQIAADPSRQRKLDEIEAQTRNFVRNGARLVNDSIVIPVVVNVLYKTTTQNISQAQIQSQIDVLNQDYNATNADFASVPALFSDVKSNFGIKFILDTIIRKSTTKSSWTSNDAMKKTAQGGIAPTSPTTKLNMWSVNFSGGLLGYAQFPGGSSATDGIVIQYNSFGNTGTVLSPYDKGRTATHEIGHWLNLRHIWGDATCGTDYVDDTPTANTANYGCPTYPHYSTCTGTPVEMTMNYMDYTDDACMYMFTNGQKTRSLAIFATGGSRNTFAQP